MSPDYNNQSNFLCTVVKRIGGFRGGFLSTLRSSWISGTGCHTNHGFEECIFKMFVDKLSRELHLVGFTSVLSRPMERTGERGRTGDEEQAPLKSDSTSFLFHKGSDTSR